VEKVPHIHTSSSKSFDISRITGRVATLFRYSERFKYSQCNVLHLLIILTVQGLYFTRQLLKQRVLKQLCWFIPSPHRTFLPPRSSLTILYKENILSGECLSSTLCSILCVLCSVFHVKCSVWGTWTEIKAWDSVRRFWRILLNKLFSAGNKLDRHGREGSMFIALKYQSKYLRLVREKGVNNTNYESCKLSKWLSGDARGIIGCNIWWSQ